MKWEYRFEIIVTKDQFCLDKITSCGVESWELVTMFKNVGIFKRPLIVLRKKTKKV